MKQLNLEDTRRLIKSRIETEIDGKIFLAPWDLNRIAFEDSDLSSMYHIDIDRFHEILEMAEKDTGYFLELINSCEAHLVSE